MQKTKSYNKKKEEKNYGNFVAYCIVGVGIFNAC